MDLPFLDISYTQNYTTCGLSVWLFSPSITFSRLIRVVTWGSMSLLSVAKCHSCMPMPRSVCAFIPGAPLGCFSLLAVVHGAAQTFVWTCFYFVWADTKEWNCWVIRPDSAMVPHPWGLTSLGLSPGSAVSQSCRSVDKGLQVLALGASGLPSVDWHMPGWLPLTRSPGFCLGTGFQEAIMSSWECCHFAGCSLHPSHLVLCSHGSESHWSGDIGYSSCFLQRFLEGF